MKKIILSFIAFIGFYNSHAQVADGTTVPDFSFKDLNGNIQNLYTYLNQGKYVVIDASATWCGPCWNFHHNAKTLEFFYDAHDIVGDNTARVLFLEADISTTLADLQGTGGSTQGDWVTGTPYPIMNPGSSPLTGETSFPAFDAAYDIPWYPAFFVICPNKKVWQDTLNDYVLNPWPPSKATFEWIGNNKCSGAVGLDDVSDLKPMAIYPNPSLGQTTIYFMLNNSSQVQMTVTNLMGSKVDEIDFGILNAGDNSIKYNTTHLASGNYSLNFVLTNGRSFHTKLTVK